MTSNLKLAMFVLVATVCAVAGICAVSENIEGIRQKQVGCRLGRIEVAGFVVSATGDTIPDVTILVETTRLNAMGFETGESQEEKVVVDGYFRIDRENVSNVRLDFVKHGFFPESRYFSVGPQPHQAHDISLSDLEIVLIERPDPAQLVSIKGQLKSDAVGPVSILQLLPGTRDAVNIRNENPPLKAHVPTLILGVAAKSNGRLEKQRTRLENRMELDIPSIAKLSFSGDEGGFLVFEPSVRSPHYWIGFREMQEAPESGYQRYLEITDEAPDYIFFYFRVNGKFGKGRITRPYLETSSDDSLVIAPVILLMNDTGGRAVATDK